MKLGYSESELFQMTPRKFFKIYREFLIMNGLKKEGDEYAIDNLA